MANTTPEVRCQDVACNHPIDLHDGATPPAGGCKHNTCTCRRTPNLIAVAYGQEVLADGLTPRKPIITNYDSEGRVIPGPRSPITGRFNQMTDGPDF